MATAAAGRPDTGAVCVGADGRGDGMSIYASLIDITMRSTEDTVVRTTINLPEPALELAKKKAAEEDASLGEVIAEAIYSREIGRAHV